MPTRIFRSRYVGFPLLIASYIVIHLARFLALKVVGMIDYLLELCRLMDRIYNEPNEKDRWLRHPL